MRLLLAALCSTALWGLPALAEEDPLSLQQWERVRSIRFTTVPAQIAPNHLERVIYRWVDQKGTSSQSLAELTLLLQNLYLQHGNPNAQLRLTAFKDQTLQVDLQENSDQPVVFKQLHLSGGTPQQRYITKRNIHSAIPGQPFNPTGLSQDLAWLEQNHFLPLQLTYRSDGPGEISADVVIDASSAILPTGNLSLWDSTGLAITVGAIVDNLFDDGNLFQVLLKRNNLEIGPITSQKIVQDWEYVASWQTKFLLPGVTLGVNHYNKVDYIFENYNRVRNQTVWVQSFGGDVFMGFPIWDQPEQRRYLRGVANLSVVQDSFFSNSNAPDASPTQLSRTGTGQDLLFLPSLNVVYSDLDDYRIPRNGQFIRTRLSGGMGPSNFAQATLIAFSFWTPYQTDEFQSTFIFRNSAGTTLGQNPPFYRGFLNAGNWLVRGATQFSIAERHSVKLSQELHLIAKPSDLNLEKFSQVVVGQAGGSTFSGWAFDLNFFLDQGAYWRDQLAFNNTQFSGGIGINAMTPAGTILGVSLATQAWPDPGHLGVLLGISAPLSFTFWSDWINASGYFLR